MLDRALRNDLFGRECRSTTPVGYAERGVIYTAAQGCWLSTEDGRRWFDATGGSGAVNLGHGHPIVNRAVHSQIDQLIHTGWNIGSRTRREAGERLANFVPIEDAAIMPCVTGTEAIEAATKIARAVTGRKSVVGFAHSYHGKTAGALALTWRSSFRTFVDLDSSHSLFLKAPFDETSEADSDRLVEEISDWFNVREKAQELPAALIIEPIQVGEGILSPGKRFLSRLRKLCQERGVLLIFDEIYTGFGRCGAPFMASKLGVIPDIMVIGKALANGFPIAAVVGRRHHMDVLPNGHHSATFAGHPVSWAAAEAVLGVMCDQQPWEQANRSGQRLLKTLRDIARNTPFMRAIRGEGLLIAFDCEDRAAPEGGPELMQRVMAACDLERIEIRGGGHRGNTIKLTPPLLMEDDDLWFLTTGLERALARVMKEL